jgi:hypothetical protein
VTPLGDGPVFVGIGTADAVDGYLGGVERAVLHSIGSSTSYDVVGASAPGALPGGQDVWVASSEGSGTRTLEWVPRQGTWTIVVMNADGTRGIQVRADMGATIPDLLWISLVVLAVGVVLLAGALAMIVIPVQRASRSGRGSAS